MANWSTYDGTETLINKRNLRDAKELESIERQATLHRLSELVETPLKGKFDLMHLKRIHNYIFQDVYPDESELEDISKQFYLKDKRSFRGKLRGEDITKGFTTFCPALYLEQESKKIFSQLKNENYLKGLEVDQFSERLAYYMAEINILHPFREGNGRSTREFIKTLSCKAGYEIDWSRLDEKELLQASIRSVSRTDLLTVQLRKAIIE